MTGMYVIQMHILELKNLTLHQTTPIKCGNSERTQFLVPL
jgi:hypothetical protein